MPTLWISRQGDALAMPWMPHMEHYTLSPSTGQTTVCCEFSVLESIYQLVKVKGIGVALIEKNQDWITVVTGPDSGC